MRSQLHARGAAPHARPIGQRAGARETVNLLTHAQYFSPSIGLTPRIMPAAGGHPLGHGTRLPAGLLPRRAPRRAGIAAPCAAVCHCFAEVVHPAWRHCLFQAVAHDRSTRCSSFPLRFLVRIHARSEPVPVSRQALGPPPVLHLRPRLAVVRSSGKLCPETRPAPLPTGNGGCRARSVRWSLRRDSNL